MTHLISAIATFAAALAAAFSFEPSDRIGRSLDASVEPWAGGRLCDSNDSMACRVTGIDNTCTGLARRRLLDLGLTPGATVRRELTGSFGGPSAYRVRGALVALRDDQAGHILVKPVTMN